MPRIAITRNNVDSYLRELGKEYRKLTGGHMPAEITLIGGASVLINYGFRKLTYNIATYRSANVISGYSASGT